MLSMIFAAVLLGSAANAAAITKRVDSGPTVWKSPDGGDTQVRFGDEKVYIGSCSPQELIKTLYDNCYDEGFCNSDSWTIECMESDYRTHTITLKTPEGQYQTWIKNGLVEALSAAIGTEGVTESRTITAQSGGGCVGCSWTATTIDVHYMPSNIGISHGNDRGVPDVITLNIVNNDADIDRGVCENVTGLGGQIAGAINPLGGGIFSVASIFCKRI